MSAAKWTPAGHCNPARRANGRMPAARDGKPIARPAKDRGTNRGSAARLCGRLAGRSLRQELRGRVEQQSGQSGDGQAWLVGRKPFRVVAKPDKSDAGHRSHPGNVLRGPAAAAACVEMMEGGAAETVPGKAPG